MNIVKTGIDKHYKGVLHPDSLIWCHGAKGVGHNKIRKFFYPFYKYSHTKNASVYRIVICICINCTMVFRGDETKNVPLSIPVKKIDSYLPYEIRVKVNGKSQSLKGELITPFRQATQEQINDDTRIFIDLVR